MSLDYQAAIYPVRQAAQAAGYNVNTLRALYQRGRFRVVGGEEAQKAGLSDMLTLADIMHVAAAKRLADCGVEPAAAFEATIGFAHSGTEGRMPGRVFPERDITSTFLVYYADSRSARIIGSDDGLTFDQLTKDPQSGAVTATLVVLLNDLVRSVANGITAGGAAQLDELA